MRILKHTCAALLCFFGTASAMAQVDVTAIYLKNAGFDTNYDYPIGTTGNVAQEMLDVDGWTNDYTVAYTIVGTYQVGTQMTFNGASVPATNVEGTTEGGVLALSTGWDESIKLYQEVTLPKGEYSLVTAYYNGCSATDATSLFGWVPSSGSAVMSSVKSFPANQWVTDTLSFNLIVRRAGKVQVGIKATSGGSANSAKFSLDYVKLLSYNWDGSIFEDAIAKAVKLYGDGTANGAAALKEVIDAANAVLNDATATPEDQVAATAAVNDAMDAYNTLQDAYKALQKAIDKALSTLGDNTGNGVAELQAAIEKAQQTVANPSATPEELQAETIALNAAVNVFKEVQTAKSALQKAIDEATALIADNTSTEATALQEAINKATQIANNMASTAEELAAATAELKEAAFIFQLANGTGTAPVVVTNDYVARGSTMALGRSTVSGVSTSNLLEQGFCWSTSPNPTVLDNRTTKYQNQNGRIYIMENLEPSTIYYVRAYALTKTYAVGYGETIKVITLPAGKVTWSYDNGADDAANARINAAVENAVYYMNTWTSINGLHTSVHYGSGTPTADCSYGGWMRVGPNASYQQTGTILHELGHAIGVGTHDMWYGSSSPLRSGSGTGNWIGDRATAAVRFLENSTTSLMNGDGTHMWPYGVNGAHEDTGSSMLYMSNTIIYQALGEDGLPPTGGFCTPAYVFEQEDTIKYYIKSEHENYGLYNSYLVMNEKGHLVWESLSANDVLSNDSAAWYITFNPKNCYYQLRNAATGRYMSYATTGTNGIRTVEKAEAGTNENFHFMRSRIDVTVGSDDNEMNLRGYWIIHPEQKAKPTTLIAAANGAVSTASFNINNNASIQRWLLLTAEETVQFESSCIETIVVGIDEVIERIKALVAVPHTEEVEGTDAAILAVLTELEAKRASVTSSAEADVFIATAKEAMRNFLSNATPSSIDQPFDITYMMTNAAIDDNSGWSDTPTLSYSCMEYFQKTFDFNQTITNLPAGTYQVRVQAYQRPGAAADVYKNYVDGADEVTTWLYAGSESVKISNIASEARTNKLGGSETQVSNIPPRYVPNNMQAASLYFAKGLYDNVLTLVIDKEGASLKVGLRCTTSNSNYWTIFDNFRLYYYGSLDKDLVSDIEEVNAPITNTSTDVYSITGVRVRANATTLEGLPAGIYIIDGHKVLIK